VQGDEAVYYVPDRDPESYLRDRVTYLPHNREGGIYCSIRLDSWIGPINRSDRMVILRIIKKAHWLGIAGKVLSNHLI